jgi:hypothetical protein
VTATVAAAEAVTATAAAAEAVTATAAAAVTGTMAASRHDHLHVLGEFRRGRGGNRPEGQGEATQARRRNRQFHLSDPSCDPSCREVGYVRRAAKLPYLDLRHTIAPGLQKDEFPARTFR